MTERLPPGIVKINGVHYRDLIEGPVEIISEDELRELAETEQRRWFSLLGSRLPELEVLVDQRRAQGEQLDYIVTPVEQISIPHAGISDEIVEVTVGGTGDWHSIHAALYSPSDPESDQ